MAKNTILDQMIAEQVELQAAGKKSGGKREFIMVVNGNVIQKLVTKKEYRKEVKRLATTDAVIKLAKIIGSASTNLDVKVKGV